MSAEGNRLADRCVKEVSMDSPLVFWLAGISQWLHDASLPFAELFGNAGMI
jgi:hypothetical protein